MDKPFKANVSWLLSIIGGISIYHANANAIEITDPKQRATTVQYLVARGFIIPLEHENWYQINRERLEATFRQNKKGNRQARHVVNLLQAIVSTDVNIREVDVLEIHLSTQDYAAGASSR